MCLKVKTLIGTTHTPWTIYSMWAPGYDEAKPISKPTAQPMLLPIIVAKIIPFEGSNTVPQTDRERIGMGYREKLNPDIKNKCIYGVWNDRGSIYTMGFKLSSTSELETLKNMETILKEEVHIHQFIVPFETAVWNEEDLAPARRAQVRDATAGDQAATPQVQDPTSSGSQNANQSNASSEQTSTALPQRETQTRGGSLPTE